MAKNHYLVITMSTLFTLASGAAYAGPLSVDVSALYMKRQGGNAGTIATDAITGGSVLDASNLNNQFDFGAAMAMTYKPSSWGGQIRGFSLKQDDNNTYVDTSGNSVKIQTDPVTNYGLNAGNTLDESLRTRLGGIEANGLYDIATGVEMFAGLRNMKLDETFNLLGNFGSTNYELDTWNVKNHMFGLNVGATVDFAKSFDMTGKWSPKVRAGVGLFRNNIDVTFTPTYDGTPYRIPSSDSASKTAYSLDLDMSMHYSLAKNTSLYAGYRLLYLNNVALGSKQVASTTSYNSQQTNTINTSNVMYHGLNLGVTYQF